MGGGGGGVSPDVVTFGPGSNGLLVVSVSGTVGGLNTNASMVGAPVVNSGAFSSTLTINNSTSNTYAGVMQDGASTMLSIAKSGAGTLTLGGNNSFTGGVMIDSGTLQLANPGALNSSTPNSVTFGSGSTGILSLNGNSITVPSLSTNATIGSPAVENASSTAAALTVNNTSSNTYAGVLQDGAGGGALSLVKNGSGTLTLGGNNTFTGGLTIDAGTLILGNANALGSTAGGAIVASGATLDLGGQAVGGEGLTISGTGVGGNGALINSSASAASFVGTVTANRPVHGRRQRRYHAQRERQWR